MSDTILIPFSGGINSTYSLYRWLTETDTSIVARYSYEQFESEDYNSRELDSLREIVIFLKSTVRDFNFQTINWPQKYVQERIPIRHNFKTGKYDLGAIRPRFEGYPVWIQETGVDAISIGISLENTATDGYDILRKFPESAGVDIYLAGMPDLKPIPTGADFDYDAIAKTMIGRFEQYESLPEELQSLCLKCNLSICKNEKCRDCAYQRTYEKFVDEDKTGRDFDLYCAKHGSYGPWRHEADPETYLYRGADKTWPGINAKLPYLNYG